MFRREHDIRGAKDGIRTRREHLNGLDIGCPNFKGEMSAFALADPRTLRFFYFFAPRECVETREKPLGIMSDFKEPLREPLLFHRRTTTLATSIDNLFICEHGLVLRAPLHRCRATLGESLFKKLHKEPLCPLIVARIAGENFFRPVKRCPHRSELCAHALDILIRPL